MRKVKILCDGGLGNRLNSLIGGLIISKFLNREPIICWPQNSWCGCSFDDLFYKEYKVIDQDIVSLFAENINEIFLIHENQTQIKINSFYPDFSTINLLKNKKEENIIYYNNSIPGFCDQQDILFFLKKLKIKHKIKKSVQDFCSKHKINEKTIGIHLRKTDFKSNINDEDIFNYIKINSSVNFFICSDSEGTENYLKALTNVVINKKKFYVQKYQEGDWNDIITDYEGRQFGFNIKRSKESVIEGFIDLLILSRTNIIIESHSTFLKFAKLYKNINIYDSNNFN